MLTWRGRYFHGCGLTRLARLAASIVLWSVVQIHGFAETGKVLSAEQTLKVDQSVERALAWLASQQRRDGSFPSVDSGQPAVTSLCAMAFLACGHMPGEGRYGGHIDAGIDYVLSCQKSNGLLCHLVPTRVFAPNQPNHTGSYNHSIAGIFLAEAYGIAGNDQADKIHKVLDAAVDLSISLQRARKKNTVDRGGWRYLAPNTNAADLSATAWHLTFLRASKNAGFDIPAQVIGDAMGYVQRCFDPGEGSFLYMTSDPTARFISRSMAGAGILSLSMGGLHESGEAQQAAEWILRHPFDQYNEPVGTIDRFHYGAYYCSQAMYQLGERYWEQFYPVLVNTLLSHQSPEGSWQPENHDPQYGNCYTTALCVLALTPPYQLLPIFQR